MPRQLQKKIIYSFGDQDRGQGVKPPVRADEKLAPVMGGIKVRLVKVSLIYCNCLGISRNAQAIEETPGISGIA